MAQVVQHNIMALNSYNKLSSNNSSLSKNLEKLSSGYKINRAGDDAAGLAISEKMRAQITGLEKAASNAQDGISLVQTAEGALTEVHSMLNRMTELATQSANGTYDDTDRQNLQDEIDQLRDEINRISDETNFNNIKLLDGSMGGGSVTADGASFKGAEVAKYQEAEVTLGIKFDFNPTNNTTVAGKDTFNIDGQALVIDWSKGDAKKIFDSVAVNNSNATVDQIADIAKKLETFFNEQMQEQGLTGSISIDKTGKMTSNVKDHYSEVSFVGSDNTNPGTSFGALLFDNSNNKGQSKINQATKTYNGDTVKNGKEFTMTINGVKVNVTTTADAEKGTTTMAAVATMLQQNIQTAINSYNTALGLTGGAKDTDSGLTGLTAGDFTVEEKDGSFLIKYNGDEEVEFSFEDVGDRTFAKAFGLTSGSSSSGGAGGLDLQIGDTKSQRIYVSVDDMDCNALGIGSIDISTETGATNAIEKIKTAINKVSTNRAGLGAIQNRLEHTITNLETTTENLTNAESRIRDTDMAKEMMSYTQNNVLSQAAQAMLAQANQQPQQVLQLLQ